MCIEGFSASDHAVRDVTGLYVRASSIQKSLSLLWFGSFGVETLHFEQGLYQLQQLITWASPSPTLELAVIKVPAATSRIVEMNEWEEMG